MSEVRTEAGKRLLASWELDRWEDAVWGQAYADGEAAIPAIEAEARAAALAEVRERVGRLVCRYGGLACGGCDGPHDFCVIDFDEVLAIIEEVGRDDEPDRPTPRRGLHGDDDRRYRKAGSDDE